MSYDWNVTILIDNRFINNPDWLLHPIYQCKLVPFKKWKSATRAIVNNCYKDLPNGVAFYMPIADIMDNIEVRKKKEK